MHSSLIVHIVAVISLVSCVASAGAQTSRASADRASVGRTLLGATAGAVLGGLIGGAVGAGTVSEEICQGGGPDACLGATIPRALWGTGIGITVGTPIGAYIGNRQQGRLAYTMLASVALFGGELLALRNLVHDGHTRHKSTVIGIAVAVPVLQIIGTTLVERAFTRP
jgi:hypothetical protein